MGEKYGEMPEDLWSIILQLTRFPRACWELKYLRQTISATSHSLYLPILILKGNIQNERSGSCVLLCGREGKGRRWTSDAMQDTARKAAARQRVFSPYSVRRSLNTGASATVHLHLFPCPLALYRETLWLSHPCSLFSILLLVDPVHIFHNMNHLLWFNFISVIQ